MSFPIHQPGWHVLRAWFPANRCILSQFCAKYGKSLARKWKLEFLSFNANHISLSSAHGGGVCLCGALISGESMVDFQIAYLSLLTVCSGLAPWNWSLTHPNWVRVLRRCPPWTKTRAGCWILQIVIPIAFQSEQKGIQQRFPVKDFGTIHASVWLCLYIVFAFVQAPNSIINACLRSRMQARPQIGQIWDKKFQILSLLTVIPKVWCKV